MFESTKGNIPAFIIVVFAFGILPWIGVYKWAEASELPGWYERRQYTDPETGECLMITKGYNVDDGSWATIEDCEKREPEPPPEKVYIIPYGGILSILPGEIDPCEEHGEDSRWYIPRCQQ